MPLVCCTNCGYRLLCHCTLVSASALLPRTNDLLLFSLLTFDFFPFQLIIDGGSGL